MPSIIEVEKKIQAPSGLAKCFEQSGQNSCSKMMVRKSTTEGKKFGKCVAPNSNILNQLHVACEEQQVEVKKEAAASGGGGSGVCIHRL